MSRNEPIANLTSEQVKAATAEVRANPASCPRQK